MASKKRTRPSLLTPERQAAILKVVREGGWKRHAARAGGIGESTLDTWLARGERALEERDKGHEPDDVERPYLDFFLAFARAEDSIELDAVKRARKNDTGEQWWLERRFPKRWGRGARVEIDQPSGSPDVVIVLPANGREAPEG